MKRIYLLVSAVVLLSLALSACGGTATETPAEEPSPSPAPVPVESTESEEPIAQDLAGPLMEVGSTYRYVDGTLLVAVPGGPFIMGHGGEDNPEHEVTLGDFWIYQTEVTNKQYAACVFVGECSPPDLNDNLVYSEALHGNDPVVGVNYDQASEYCGWVHGRLPSEAEWEKTARGPEGNIYPWGDAAPSCELLNTANCVGQPANVLDYGTGMSYYKALQLAGNIFEWVADWYSPTYYGLSPAEDPLGPEFGEKRSVRSTGFARSFFESDSARRWSSSPLDHRNDICFRCVVMDPTYFAPFCKTNLIAGVDANGLPLPGSDPSEDCPDIGINVVQKCGPNYTPFTELDFTGISPAPPNLSTSWPSYCAGGPPSFFCSESSPVETANVSADCTITNPPDMTCPDGTVQDGDTCKAEGREGECLVGSTYDPVNMCCSALEANGVQWEICPAGQYETPAGCVPFPAAGGVSVTKSVPFDACEPPGNNDGGDDGGCPPGTSEYCYTGQQGQQVCICR